MNIRVSRTAGWKLVSLAALGAILGGSGAAALQPPAKGLTPAMIADFGGDKHITRPSQDATMGFSQPTRVTEVLARGGQTVKAGELLIRGEDAEESGRLRLQKIQAGNDYAVQRAMRTAELAKLEHEKFTQASKSGSASEQEIERSRLTWEGAEIDVQIARMQKDQEQITVEMAQSRLDRLQVRAPFDGQVDVILADVGQSLSENDKVLRIVKIDPLFIDVPVPTEKVLHLKIKNGDPAWVLMQYPGEPKVHTATVREVAPTADSASATVRVRVEIPNPSRIIAGLSAWVRFEAPTGAWADRIVDAKAIADGSSSSKDGALKEFDKALDRAGRAMADGNFGLARDEAVTSRLIINNAPDRFTEAELEGLQVRVDELLATIDAAPRDAAKRAEPRREEQQTTQVGASK